MTRIDAITRRRLLLIVVLPLTIVMVLVLGVLAMSTERTSVTKENYDRLHEGMAMAEVEQLLDGTGMPVTAVREDRLLWFADNGAMIEVLFEDDVVKSKLWHEPDPLMKRIRRWLHL